MRLPDATASRSNFGLDYDGTFDRDPGLWREFVRLALVRGHRVCVVTYRDAWECQDIAANLPGIEVIATGGQPKRSAADAAGFTVDVWIDDMPELIPSIDEIMSERVTC